MAFDNNGQFQRVHNWTEDKQNKIPVTASRMDAEDNNFAAGLSKTLLRDGSVIMTGNLAVGNHKITGVSNGTANTDAVNKSQLDTKQDTITGAASTVVTSNLLANKLLVSNSSGKITASDKAVTDIPDDSILVHKTGIETIDGTKTFTSSVFVTKDSEPAVSLKNTNMIKGTTPSNSQLSSIHFIDRNGKKMGSVINYYFPGTVGNRVMTILEANRVNSASDTVSDYIGVGFDVQGNVTTHAPACDNVQSIVTTINNYKDLNGYFKLGNGLIIQWGYNSSTNSGRTITFPTPFTSNYGLSIVKCDQGGTGDDYTCMVGNEILTSFKVFVNTPIRWIAIGY